ncbi:23S rRNA (guanosine(2251)-2'-O)-methyltransferase RlmB [Psychrobacter sp. Cmf 22.2]|uniref:23S rRNA (guanosine(2251)-2'-O)-methyltransferase RlmB n=1 Tax=Psychrobacter sp. Cmf 22.2 TaxID=1926478 RepID=UPI000946FD3E|nr:23S rRNA (guanosine(2251)-2'-O)-methyltransferase RlmB [Psychrobacter sp. Cmf 22.2]OLF37451.1 23S rRNA (guanosine(2251)-2'-O)-methyltransferase RlmB [Psychrobacter sp. Cmf 22.2]
MAKPSYFYGIHAIDALLEHRSLDALSLFVQQGRENDSHVKDIIAQAQANGISMQPTQKDKLTQLCGSPQHQGVVLHARPLGFADEGILDNIIGRDQCLLLVLDQITDAHNFGACLRTAVAMGVDAVVCPKHHAASLTPTVAKVSVGAAEMMPIISVTNLARTLTHIKDAGVFVFGTALNEKAKPLHAADLTGKTALIMGSEGEGMRRLTTESCDELVYIPMSGNEHGNLQSLNVSVATGMALYEVNRQRTLAAGQA